MSSRVALNLFPPLGMDTKGQTGRMDHKTRLNTHFKAPSRLCTKSFSPTSLQAKELHHINAASKPKEIMGTQQINQHIINPAPAKAATVLTSHHVTVICHEMFSDSYSFSTPIYTCGRAGFSEEPGSLEWGMLSNGFLLAVGAIFI